MYSRRQFLKISGGFIAGAALGGICGVLGSSSPLDRFMHDMRAWDTSNVSRDMLLKIAAGELSEADRDALYGQAFYPNKEQFVHGWGIRWHGRPGAFSIESR